MELMKRENVIKALECCGCTKYDLQCDECPLQKTMNCNRVLNRSALTLIKELIEEIKGLEEEYDHVYEQAEANIHGNMADGGTSCHWCADKTKADIVKKMQEKLNDTKIKIGSDYYIYANNVDVIAREMLEENDAEE